MSGSGMGPKQNGAKLLKRLVRRVVSTATGYEIIRADKVLEADSAAVFISNYVHPVRRIFDVGANTGQSVRKYHALFPDAEIVSFEPVAKSYSDLAAVSAATPKARAFNCALGAQIGEATIYVPSQTLSSTLLASGAGHPAEKVRVDTIDHVRADLGLDFVDLVKIDVEGFELEVIAGACTTLDDARVGMVFAEVGLRDDNTFHVHFGRVYAALAAHGFESFGLYDVKYWVGAPFANALFIHRSCIKR